MATNNRGNTGKRGFAAMSKNKVEDIASMGGKARAKNRTNGSNRGGQNDSTTR